MWGKHLRYFEGEDGVRWRGGRVKYDGIRLVGAGKRFIFTKWIAGKDRYIDLEEMRGEEMWEVVTRGFRDFELGQAKQAGPRRPYK